MNKSFSEQLDEVYEEIVQLEVKPKQTHELPDCLDWSRSALYEEMAELKPICKDGK